MPRQPIGRKGLGAICVVPAPRKGPTLSSSPRLHLAPKPLARGPCGVSQQPVKGDYRTLVATSGSPALRRAAGTPRPDIILPGRHDARDGRLRSLCAAEGG